MLVLHFSAQEENSQTDALENIRIVSELSSVADSLSGED